MTSKIELSYPKDSKARNWFYGHMQTVLNADEKALETLLGIHRSKPLSENDIYNWLTEKNHTSSSIALHKTLNTICDFSKKMKRMTQLVLQSGSSHISLDSPSSKKLFPLDYYKNKHATFYDALGKDHKQFIQKILLETFLPTEEEFFKLMQTLPPSQNPDRLAKTFKKFVLLAQEQRENLRGFIHFKSPKHHTPTQSRVYVRATDVVSLAQHILLEMDHFPEVKSVKVACPANTQRSDHLVIYIADPQANASDIESILKTERKILKKLKELRRKNPSLFSNELFRLKNNEEPGIATAPIIAADGTPTRHLSQAIAMNLKDSNETLESFKKKIMTHLLKKWDQAHLQTLVEQDLSQQFETPQHTDQSGHLENKDEWDSWLPFEKRPFQQLQPPSRMP